MFQIIAISIFGLLDYYIWRMSMPLARGTRASGIWRWLVSLWIGAMFCLTFFILYAPRIAGPGVHPLPQSIESLSFIWQILICPVVAIVILSGRIIGWARTRFSHKRLDKVDSPAPANPITPGAAELTISRRDLLKMSALTATPLATMALAGVAADQLGKFRVKYVDLPVHQLPKSLDGLSIAIVADIHTGIFSTPKMLADILQTTNNLRADLILLPGDLINNALADLPGALDMVMKMDARNGVYLVEGNHDVMHGHRSFDDAVRRRGAHLLLDEAVNLRPRGVPVQLFGTRWPLDRGEDEMRESIETIMPLRDPDAFPIVMAHHPHTWDAARENGLPLVLAGHTHGGQLMLTKNIGAGPLRFRYWQGLYEKDNSSLLISNGVGNWFPLRINAPAEILKVTLHTRA